MEKLNMSEEQVEELQELIGGQQPGPTRTRDGPGSS